jgi:hypothetical protein
LDAGGRQMIRRYATMVKRDPILMDFFSKLKRFADHGEIPTSRARLRDVATRRAALIIASAFC